MTRTSATAPPTATHQPLLMPPVLALLATWGIAIMLIARAGMFDTVGNQPPFAIVVAALLPPILFLLTYSVIDRVRDWVAAVDLGLVTAIQGWRVVGAAFVFTWGYDMLPGAFAIPAGYGDILVGLAAPFVALKIWQQTSGWRTAAYSLIVAGFMDFIGAFTMGVMLRENGPLYHPGDVHTGLLAEFPLTMIPAFLVPVFMILHIIAIIKLKE